MIGEYTLPISEPDHIQGCHYPGALESILLKGDFIQKKKILEHFRFYKITSYEIVREKIYSNSLLVPKFLLLDSFKLG